MPRPNANVRSSASAAETIPAHPVSSWSVSLALHVAILLLLIFAGPAPPAGQDEIAGQEIGIVLEGEPGESVDATKAVPQQPADTTPPVAAASQPIVPSEAPVDLSNVLPPQDLDVIGPGPRASGSADNGPNGSQTTGRGLGGLGLGEAGGAGARRGTAFFGVEDPAQRVAYLVDRSASMADQNRLADAKVELVASIERLKEHQQFQVMFYNRELAIFRVDQTGRMPFADQVNKTLAHRFVSDVEANGSTDHYQALLAAMRYGPDALYFLTDADEPRLRPRELDEVTRQNAGRTRIHAIEFGVGPSLGDDNFLKQLARQNGGSYRYVEVRRRP